jgi:hypothetical protein
LPESAMACISRTLAGLLFRSTVLRIYFGPMKISEWGSAWVFTVAKL